MDRAREDRGGWFDFAKKTDILAKTVFPDFEK